MKLLYGAAYYDEYMPCERLETDMQMMQEAGINLIRIAESTWSTEEPADGKFDFSHVTRVMDAAERHGIRVIIGTPTYAVPAWLVREHPDILAVTMRGQGIYGCRQIMDITNADYLAHAERIIRKLAEVTCGRKCVIGYQLDNETKYYDTAGAGVQRRFVAHLKEKFHGSCEEMNRAYGLDYWSNRVDDWDDFPDVRGSVNAGIRAEFDRFRRGLVTQFLRWQADIVGEYRRPDQFLTQNFDFEWRGYSYGVQPYVDQRAAAQCLSIAGCDIYHPSQSRLTGRETAFCGDLTRSLKEDNYLVLETQAQGHPDWTPYPGQLRLQAYSHLASGADGVEYWHWHSIHNSVETYWKGILSHDFAENRIYREIAAIGREWETAGDRLYHLKKHNRAAILVSNDALTAVSCFPAAGLGSPVQGFEYNDIVRRIYDALYRCNVECDFLWPDAEGLERYDLLIVPALYECEEPLLLRLKTYVENGGNLLATFRSFVADSNMQVRHERLPYQMDRCFGVHYEEATVPENESRAEMMMELLEPDGAEVLLTYDNPAWKDYAAAAVHDFGRGKAFYLGCLLKEEAMETFLNDVLKRTGIPASNNRFPVIVRRGMAGTGKEIVYYFNYSAQEQTAVCVMEAQNIFTAEHYSEGSSIRLKPWDAVITEG
jgi:beta-galactosidase